MESRTRRLELNPDYAAMALQRILESAGESSFRPWFHQYPVSSGDSLLLRCHLLPVPFFPDPLGILAATHIGLGEGLWTPS